MLCIPSDWLDSSLVRPMRVWLEAADLWRGITSDRRQLHQTLQATVWERENWGEWVCREIYLREEGEKKRGWMDFFFSWWNKFRLKVTRIWAPVYFSFSSPNKNILRSFSEFLLCNPWHSLLSRRRHHLETRSGIRRSTMVYSIQMNYRQSPRNILPKGLAQSWRSRSVWLLLTPRGRRVSIIIKM